METLELSRAELWFCAPDTAAIGEARLFELKSGSSPLRVWIRLAPSKLRRAQDGKRGHELFFQRESRSGLTAVLRRDDTLFWSEEKREDEAVWESYLGNMIVGHTSRVWLPEGADRFGVALFPTKEGAVFKPNEELTQRSGVSFQWEAEVSFEQFAWWPQRELNAFCSTQFKDVNSPLRRAHEWQGLNEEERTAHVFRCENGTWDELRSLGQSVLNLNYLRGDEAHYVRDVWDMFDSEPYEYDSDVLELWVKMFAQVFRPFSLYNTPLEFETAHLNTCWESFPERPQVEPSAHEKLEAYLRLRDWLRANAPEEEERLMGLFPPLSA